MAKFKILTSRNCRDEPPIRQCVLDVQVIDGELHPGSMFRLYETHHYTDYTISSVEVGVDYCVVHAKPDLWYDGWHEGTILDTDNREAGRRYGYDGAGKLLFHSDALKAINETKVE